MRLISTRSSTSPTSESLLDTVHRSTKLDKKISLSTFKPMSTEVEPVGLSRVAGDLVRKFVAVGRSLVMAGGGLGGKGGGGLLIHSGTSSASGSSLQ